MKSNNDKGNKGFGFWQRLLVTGFGSGYSPFAPGTMGAIVACLIWLLLYFLLPFRWCQGILLILLILFTVLGIPAATNSEKVWGGDPSRVVVDEMVGVMIPLLVVPGDDRWWMYALASLVLFRFFDIAKPLGVRRMERFPGGWGIMADDILAGVYSAVILIVCRWWIE